MASIINALSSGTGGIVTAGDASGILQLQTANTAALTVNTNGSLTVSSTGSGITYASSGGSGLRMYGAAGTNQWDVYGNGANIRFSDNTGGGIVVVDTAARFGSTIGVGGTTPSSSGAGITFPATQSASSDANTLDDYEEGTWTPSLGGTTTYVSQIGAYTKIGRFVLATFEVHVSSIGTGSTLSIAGLPFTSFSTPTNGMGGMVGYYSTAANSIYFLTLRLDLNSTTISLATVTTAGATLNTGSAFFQNGTRVLASICYMTA